jgi:hypothetical protein
LTAWPEFQPELGGARVYYVTKKYWDEQSYQGLLLPRFDLIKEVVTIN